MSDNESTTVNKLENSTISEEYNPKLDFFSEEFDPLLVLRTPNVKVPVVNAKIYDNIHMYKSAHDEKLQNREKSQKKAVKEATVVERRWLPHQLPIKTQKKIITRNVFTRMENIQGPLSLLRTCKDKRLRIKITTRHSHGIRGYCLAFVVAFDKHWNLALEDIDEIWTRPKKRKIPALDSCNYNNRNIEADILPPKITLLKTTKKTEVCSRHIDQLLLRGEHIVMIAVIDQDDT